MTHPYQKKTQTQNSVALERIKELFSQADLMATKDKNLSKRYIILARKISTRFKVKFSKEQKMHFCKNCNAYLKQGLNSRTRIANKKIIISCLECNHVKRLIYK